MTRIIPGLLLIASTWALATDCERLFEEHLETDLQLDYQAFDQTQGQGFRALAEAGCPREAADLIEAYVDTNGATQRSLTWHVAQLRGESGQVDEAIAAARRSLDTEESADQPFKWNAHVRAYLAFLEGDREAFDRQLEILESAADAHRGNEVNAGMWRRLAPHFDAGYARAISLGYR